MGKRQKKTIRRHPAPSFDTQIGRAKELYTAGRLSESRSLCESILQRNPKNASALYILAHALDAAGDHDEALRKYEKCLEMGLSHAKVHFAIGNIYRQQGLLPKAIESYQRSLRIDPGSAPVYNNLGLVFFKLDRMHEAEVCFRKALACKPDYAQGYNNLGTVLQALGRHAEAIGCFRKKIQLCPDQADGYENLAVVFERMGRREEADFFYSRALELNKELPRTIFNTALTLLAMGRLTEGWTAYERRLDLPTGRKHAFSYPTWDGSSLERKTLLILSEQGLGDEVLFSSCVPDVIAQAGHCILQCEPRLEPLFQRSFPGATVLGTGKDDQATLERLGGRKVDYCITQGSLPRYFRASLDRFPDQPGYLQPDHVRTEEMRAWLDSLGPGLKVGICWRSMLVTTERNKVYTRIEDWEEVLKTPGVEFVNLQYGECDAELAETLQRTGVRVHHMPGLNLTKDLDGAAALTAALDLVVTVNTAVGSLSGALGVPTLVLTSGGWPTLGTGRLPWYPQTKIVDFRVDGRELLTTRIGAWLDLLALPKWQGAELGGASLVVYGEQSDSIVSCLPFLAALADRYGERCVMLANEMEAQCLMEAFPSVQLMPDHRFSTLEHVDRIVFGKAVRVAVEDLPTHFGGRVPADCPETLTFDRGTSRPAGDPEELQVGVWYCWDLPEGGALSSRYGDIASWSSLLEVAGVTVVNLNPSSDAAMLGKGRGAGELALVYQAAENWVERAAFMSGLDLIISTVPAPLCTRLGVPVWHPELSEGAYCWSGSKTHVKVWGRREEEPSVIIERMASDLREMVTRRKAAATAGSPSCRYTA